MVDRGDWIHTFTGRFFPLDPHESEIDIETIAHALSNLCRFGGHVNRFYSVAQHSVLCSRMAPDEYKLEALLHDASEAYLVDMPSPIKAMLPDYKAMEHNIEKVIAAKFNLPSPLSPIVKIIDRRMLITEAAELLNDINGTWWTDGRAVPYDITELQIIPWSAKESYHNFISTYRELSE